MQHFKNHSSWKSVLASPFHKIWQLVKRIWPERTITIIQNGNVDFYQQSSRVRFLKATTKAILGIWALWSTYVFVYHRPMLEQKTRELDMERTFHAQQMADLVIFQKKFVDLHRQLTTFDEQILKQNKVGNATIDSMLKQRLQWWGELDYLQTKISNIYTDNNYAPDYLKQSELSMEVQLTREENRQLSQRNSELEQSMTTIHDAQTRLIDKVSNLAKNNIDNLDKDLRKISGTLTSLGLNQNALAERAQRADLPYLGGTFTPLDYSKMKNIDPKYLELAKQINLWEGLSRTKTMLPVGNPVKNPYITSQFGGRDDPFNGTPTMHRGIDFAGEIGTPLYAVAPGRVTQSGWRSGYGNSVEIEHGMGFTTLYAHLQEIRVKKGDFIEPKDVIGLGGSSGRSTGPHLHYEIRYNGQPFNPYTFIKAKQIDF